MGSAFNEEERLRIRTALLDTGERHFAQYGVRRARVEDIARETGIAKGSFYLFFESKEELFLQLLERLEGGDRARIVESLLTLPPAERLPGLIEALVSYLDQSAFLRRALTGEDIVWLERKVSPERLKEHMKGDDLFMREFVTLSDSERRLDPQEASDWGNALRSGFETYIRADESSRGGALLLLRALSHEWKERMT